MLEHNSIRIIREIVRPGDTIFDIDAWQGPYTLLFSKLIGSFGKVYSFEPDPVARRVLR